MVETHLFWFSPRKLGEKISILTFLFFKGVGWWKATNQTLGFFGGFGGRTHPVTPRSPWEIDSLGSDPRGIGAATTENGMSLWPGSKGGSKGVKRSYLVILWCVHPWNVAWNLKNHDLEKGQTCICAGSKFWFNIERRQIFNQRVDFKRRYASAQRTEHWNSVGIGKAWVYGCFLKWWYPQNTPKWSKMIICIVVGKPHGCWVPPF